MKLNKFIIALGVAGLTLAACENEFNDDVQLNVNVAAENGISFDGKTITVKAGTPVDFKLAGDPDYLTFFSGEAGKEYKNRERIQVDESEIESSVLKFSLQGQYGKPANILNMYISEEFPGLAKNNFKEDSVLVEKHLADGLWKTLIAQNPTVAEEGQPAFPTAATTTPFELDMKSYLGKRIAIAICYQGQDNTAAQSRFYFKDMQILNTMTNGQQTKFTASSFGFTPINMCQARNYADQKSMTSNRAYGTVTNNTSGIWNFVNFNNFFIHSSNAKTDLKYSWLVSNLLVVNACSPDAGTALKNVSQSLDSYKYTYSKPGTYTATFVASNFNFKKESQVVKEYQVVVTE